MVTERTTGVDTPTFGDFRQGRLGAQMQGRHRELLSLQQGRSLQKFNVAPAPDNGFLEGFRTRNKTPQAPEIFHSTEDPTNVVHPITRNVMQQAEMFGSPHPYELLIMYKDPERRSNPLHDHRSGLMIECDPLAEFTPAVFNYIETLRQQALYENEKTRDDYLRLSPADIWQNYVFDGVVETQSPSQSAGHFGPKFTHHVFDSSYGGPRGPRSSGTMVFEETTIDGSRLLTVDARGPAPVFNYWGSNIQPGGKLYAVIKKYPQELDFVLARETGNHIRNVESAYNTVTQKPFFRPYLMGFYCLPPGTRSCPRELLQYIDELGYTRYDGWPIFLGTVHTVPPDHKYIEFDLRDVKPYTGMMQKSARESTHLMSVIFDTSSGTYLF